MWTVALFGAIHRVFRNLWCVHTDKGEEGVKPMRIFFGQEGGGSIFSRFCADVFYGRSLSIAFSFYKFGNNILINYTGKKYSTLKSMCNFYVNSL